MLCKGTTLQAAENLDVLKGHDFSRPQEVVLF